MFFDPHFVKGFFFSFPEQVTFGKTGSGKCAVFVFFCDCLGLVCKEEFGMSLVVFGIRLGVLGKKRVFFGNFFLPKVLGSDEAKKFPV